MKRANHANRAIFASFGLVALAIALLVWIPFRMADEALRAQVMAQRTGTVLLRISHLRESLARAVSAQRGYLLTGEAPFLRAREDALQRFQQHAAAIGDELADNPIQRERSQQLVTLIDERAALMHNMERMRASEGGTVASRELMDQLAEAATQPVSALLDAMALEETRSLTTHQQREREKQQAMRPMLLALGLAIIALLVPLLWTVVRQARRRRQAEARLRVIDESLPGAVFVVRVTPAGVATYEFLSVHAGKLMGIEREEVLRDARAARALIIQEDRGRVNAALTKSATELSELGVDFRIRKPGGEIRWVRSTATPARRANGDMVWSGYWLDITEIKDNEQAYQHAMRRLEDAHSVAGLGDWSYDFATRAMTWSFQIYEMLEREPAMDALSLEEAVAIFENGVELTTEAFFRARKTGEPQGYEMTACLPSGQTATLHMIAVPTLNQAREVVGMHGTAQDITARKALEEGLYQAKEAADKANRAKSEFLATMSHEIRTPLSGMLGLLELMSLMPLQPELSSALRGVRESGKALQHIIDDILDFSKVEAGKMEIHLEPTRIGDVVAALQRAHGKIASSHGLELHCSIDPRIRPVVMLDSLRLQQILGNFISNAIKFTPTGRIDLRVRLVARNGDREQLRYEVEDTGIGIAPEHQQRIFRPFEQADANPAGRSGGTGLGLSICRRLAELLGGQVSMTSELGKGTTMVLDLPVTATDRPPVAVPQKQDSAPALPVPVEPEGAATQPVAVADALVLVVDDHPINRMLMCKQLNTLGYAAEDVASGAEALQKWKTGRFALIWTDCNMPVMSGYELSKQIRAAEAASGRSRTPIIACSANVIGAVRQDCLDAGMDDYISKPTDLGVLSEKMRRWLPSPAEPAAGEAPAEMAPTAAQSALEGGHAPDAVPAAPKTEPEPEAAVSRKVIERFQRVNRVDVERLLQAFEQRDMPAIAHLAHRIKGACGFIGATGLAAVCAMLEQAGRTGDEPALDWLMETFQSELEQLNARLDAA